MNCSICGQETNGDQRTLALYYLYDLSEISDKLAYDNDTRLWSVKTCKDCRGEFLGLLRKWLKGNLVTQPDPTANIPVRVDGRVVFMTQGEFEVYRQNLQTKG